MDNIVLSDFFTTKSQAKNFSACLNAISENIYETDFNLEKVLREQIGSAKADKFVSLLRENGVSLQSNNAVNSFISKIQETITSLLVAEITFAIEPTDEILKSVADWFLLNIKKQILIEPTTDSQIIAGIIVSYQGKHVDASLKSLFQKACDNTLQISSS